MHGFELFNNCLVSLLRNNADRFPMLIRFKEPFFRSILLSNEFLFATDKLQARLRGEGGVKALLGMVKCGHPDVLAQVARGIANFAKCESRAATQGDTLHLLFT